MAPSHRLAVGRISIKRQEQGRRLDYSWSLGDDMMFKLFLVSSTSTPMECHRSIDTFNGVSAWPWSPSNRNWNDSVTHSHHPFSARMTSSQIKFNSWRQQQHDHDLVSPDMKSYSRLVFCHLALYHQTSARIDIRVELSRSYSCWICGWKLVFPKSIFRKAEILDFNGNSNRATKVTVCWRGGNLLTPR